MTVELDAQTREFLEIATTRGGPKLEEMPVSEARAALSEIMHACGVERVEVGQCRDVSIEGPGGALRLRTYRTERGTPGSSPALVFFHGGGWTLGSIEDYDSLTRWLCRHTGAAVVSVGYRLAPEHRFPAALDDCYAALLWIFANAAALDVDPDRIAVAGDSAGANLAAALCHLARDRRGPAISRQILLCPLLDLTAKLPFASRDEFGGGDYFISGASIQWTTELYLGDRSRASDPLASPILSPDFSDLPAALVVTAGYDPLRDEGEAYGASLREAGIAATCQRFETTIHGFMSFAGMLEVGRAGLDYVCGWIRSNVSGGGHDDSRPEGRT